MLPYTLSSVNKKGSEKLHCLAFDIDFPPFNALTIPIDNSVYIYTGTLVANMVVKSSYVF